MLNGSRRVIVTFSVASLLASRIGSGPGGDPAHEGSLLQLLHGNPEYTPTHNTKLASTS